MSIQILGLSGAKGSGKDSFANVLVRDHGFVRIGFADSLYQEVAHAYSTTVEELGRRDLKETAQPRFAPAMCKDSDFVEVLRELETRAGRRFDMGIPMSPRAVLQLWGAEYRRKQDPLYWLHQVQTKISALPRSTPGIVITDVRYRNEATLIHQMGGQILRVVRDVIDQAMAQARERKEAWAVHDSETEMLDWKFDGYIDNNGSLEDLVSQVSVALRPDSMAA